MASAGGEDLPCSTEGRCAPTAAKKRSARATRPGAIAMPAAAAMRSPSAVADRQRARRRASSHTAAMTAPADPGLRFSRHFSALFSALFFGKSSAGSPSFPGPALVAAAPAKARQSGPTVALRIAFSHCAGRTSATSSTAIPAARHAATTPAQVRPADSITTRGRTPTAAITPSARRSRAKKHTTGARGWPSPFCARRARRGNPDHGV